MTQMLNVTVKYVIIVGSFQKRQILVFVDISLSYFKFTPRAKYLRSLATNPTDRSSPEALSLGIVEKGSLFKLKIFDITISTYIS